MGQSPIRTSGCDDYARMAEWVDALVSNTSSSDAVPVRARLRAPSDALALCREIDGYYAMMSVR